MTVVGTLYMAYYLLTTGSQFGRKKSRVWIQKVSFSIIIYFCFIKPIVVYLVYVIVPGLVRGFVHRLADPTGEAYPFTAPLPATAAFFLLRWHPELRGTRAGDAVEAAYSSNAALPGAAAVARIHQDMVNPTDHATDAGLVAFAFLFALHEDLQDVAEAASRAVAAVGGFLRATLVSRRSVGRSHPPPQVVLEEIFCFTPMLTGPLLGFLPMPESAGGKGGSIDTAVGLVLFVIMLVSRPFRAFLRSFATPSLS